MYTFSRAYCDKITYPPQRASILLKNYGHMLTWGNGKKEMIADVGCADGATTKNILLPFCNGKVGEVIGFDISSDLIHVAKKINEEPNVTFVEMDVAKKDLNITMVNKFDHIFSFSCLHMISDQKQVADNLFKMLKPNGEAFITFLTQNTLTESWFILSRYDRWSKYLVEFTKRYSGMLSSDRAREEFERVFTNVGFSVQTLDVEGQQRSTDRKKFEDAVTNVNLPISNIPENLRDEFIKDNLELMTELCKKEDSYEISFKEIVAIVRKN